MKTVLKIFALVVITYFAKAQGNFIKDSLDTYIPREMQRWNLPGLSIAVVKDGKVIYMKGFGYADVTKKIPATENTEYQIASNSKAFTGTATALLDYYGRLKLDEKVKTYLPYFKMQDDYLTEHITVRDVLSHRIGYETFQTDLLNWASTKTRRELVENMANVTPRYGFREKYGYCNMGFVTAGEVILAASDTTWDDYLKYHIFKPLGMDRTGTTYQNFISSPNASKAYTMIDGKLIEIIPAKVDNIGAAGSMTSNVKDLSKWLMLQLAEGKYDGKQIIPAEVIQKTRQPNTIVSNGTKKGSSVTTYGLGWFMKEKNGMRIITHDGGANGFLSKTVLIPEENLAYVILTNSDAQYFFDALDGQITNDLIKQPYTNISAAYYDFFKKNSSEEQDAIDKLRKEVAAYKSKKDEYKKLEGSYTNKVYGKIFIKDKGTYAEVSFEFHPTYKGKIQFKSPTAMMIEYNADASLGVKEINWIETNGQKQIEIKVSDFVDKDTYLFTKI